MAREVTVDEISDESSFYGDDDSDEEVKRLEGLVRHYDVNYYWKRIHPYEFNTIRWKALKAQQKAEAEKSSTETESDDDVMTDASIKQEEDEPKDKNNALPRSYSFPPRDSTYSKTSPPSAVKTEEGSRDGDTVMTDVFSGGHRTSLHTATGLTPSNTPADAIGPWIYVAAPEPRHIQADTARLVAEGTRALHRYENDKAALQLQRDTAPAGSRQAAARALLRRRQELERELFVLARQTGVVSGKWMLFITADRVDEVWAVVAEATVRGELGFGAKVATDDGQGRARLIAIYTQDHEDREDVARVLKKMIELQLVKEDEKPIYYKCDAFTHLEIMANNPWGLKASRFSSRDVLRGEM
ncbi:DUF1917-domain-containing protein [Aspergillus saccharolyticus JOP 1030-1]|uniref:DUF1917-domain-containing protein n=1 Tax=Aspergillus saccharolyticus JOP 1030-1 TaxID=1450539 RepID=A0A318ZB78_9EURO|nr:DUF1917-domain-containing protein [Aspergillus saccharolyticus JOP 1030-1]PYH41963.1 DUF1917-domain-containing protein [Aspergillus saccharolyticus JOP 1030-1]